MYSCQIYLFYELPQEVHEIYIIMNLFKQVYKIAETVDEDVISVHNFSEKIWF